jgi:hypothetical protein
MNSILRLCAGIALACLVGCSGDAGAGDRERAAEQSGGQGRFVLTATDAPFPHELVESAEVWISEIKLLGPGGFRTIHSGTPIQLELTALRNGLTAELVDADVPAGEYKEIRLQVERARLVLIDGDVFDSDLGTLSLTSTATAGIKLRIDPPLAVGDGVARSVLLDFDLTKTFHAVPAATPLDASSFLLMPKIHVSNESDSGEVRGIVQTSDGAGGLVAVENATVYLLEEGETDLGQALRTTATELDGGYALLGVAPGTYDLVAEFGALTDRVDGRAVFVGSVTLVDFVLE